MATKTETTFRKKVRKDLGSLLSRGFPLWFEAIQQKAIKGTPDFLLCANGHFIALELKAAKGIVSHIQAAKLDDIGFAGGLALVADPGNWKTVLNTILFFLEKKDDCNRTHIQTEKTGNDPARAIKALTEK